MNTNQGRTLDNNLFSFSIVNFKVEEEVKKKEGKLSDREYWENKKTCDRQVILHDPGVAKNEIKKKLDRFYEFSVGFCI